MNDPADLRPEADWPTFETLTRVRFHEVDALGHVNNAAYLNYLEQAAIDHATIIGLDMAALRRLGGVFVARRHEIEFLRPAFAGDVLRIVTWLNDPRGARVDRNYRVFLASEAMSGIGPRGRLVDGARVQIDAPLVVRAATEWVFASSEGKPRRIPREVMELFRSQQERAHGDTGSGEP